MGDDIVIDGDYIGGIDMGVGIDVCRLAEEAAGIALLYEAIDSYHIGGVGGAVIVGVGTLGEVALAHDVLEAVPAGGVDYG